MIFPIRCLEVDMRLCVLSIFVATMAPLSYAFGQSSPVSVDPKRTPVPTDASVKWTPTMWQRAFAGKVDTKNGVLQGGAIDGATTLPGPTQAAMKAILLATGIRLTPQMYGAVADGSTNDTAAVQAAVAAVCGFANPGGEIFFPAGNYRITSVTIPCQGVYLVGAGVGNRDKANGTVINSLAGGKSPVFYFRAGSANYTYGGGVMNMAFKNDGNTIHPFIEADYTQQFVVDHVYSWGAYVGIRINGGIALHMSRLRMEAMLPGGTGIELYGEGKTASGSSGTRLDTPVLDDISLSAGDASGPTGSVHATGILIHGFVATPQLLHVEILNAHYGVRIDCGGINQTATELDACVQFPDMRDVEIDFPDLYGIYAEDFQFLKCIGCYVHGSSTMANGIKLANNKFMSYGAEILGGKVDSAQGSLVYSTVQGTHVTDNDLASANEGGQGGAAVEMQADKGGSTVAHSIIAGNTMCLFRGVAPTTMTGVNIGATMTSVAVTGNDFTGCATGVAYSGTSASIVQSGNVAP